jgi:hypothetical protein
MEEHDGSSESGLGRGNRPVWFVSASGDRDNHPHCLANTLLFSHPMITHCHQAILHVWAFF